MATHPATEQASAWRWFPWVIAAGLAIVVAVNIFMAVAAYRSAPGLAVQGSFATSNAYGRIQQEARRQIGLGWSLDVSMHGEHLDVVVRDAGGAPLPAARVIASASRPLGDAAPLPLDLVAISPERYRSAVTLPARGQWDVLFNVTSEGRSFRHVRRVVVP